MALNPINHLRTKYIDLCYYVVREIVAKRGKLRIDYVKIDDILANRLTKALGNYKYNYKYKRLGLRP